MCLAASSSETGSFGGADSPNVSSRQVTWSLIVRHPHSRIDYCLLFSPPGLCSRGKCGVRDSPRLTVMAEIMQLYTAVAEQCISEPLALDRTITVWRWGPGGRFFRQEKTLGTDATPSVT